MLTKEQVDEALRRTAQMLANTHIVLTARERKDIEVADFGLNDLTRTGLQIVVYVNNDRYCAKEMVMFPGQTCPEHKHPPIGDDPGKRETFRVRSGKVWLCVDGQPAHHLRARAPEGREEYYTVFHEIELDPGEQYTIEPGTLHWFQAGEEGAVVSEFSSCSRDEADVFTDTRIRRIPELEGE